MAKLTEEQRRFLEENPFVGVATTLREDGSPHTTVVWVDVYDGQVGFNTVRGNVKERNLARDPRTSLLVVDPQDPWRWVSVSGRAELTEQGADDQIDKLAKKYIGKDSYPWRDPARIRVSVRITPEKVTTTGLDGD